MDDVAHPIHPRRAIFIEAVELARLTPPSSTMRATVRPRLAVQRIATTNSGTLDSFIFESVDG